MLLLKCALFGICFFHILGYIPKRAHFNRSIFQKQHILHLGLYSKKGHISKWAYSFWNVPFLECDIPCGPSMIDCLFIGNLPETCWKPAGNLPETCQKPVYKGFWQVSGRFPTGFWRYPEIHHHTVVDWFGNKIIKILKLFLDAHLFIMWS